METKSHVTSVVYVVCVLCIVYTIHTRVLHVFYLPTGVRVIYRVIHSRNDKNYILYPFIQYRTKISQKLSRWNNEQLLNVCLDLIDKLWYLLRLKTDNLKFAFIKYIKYSVIVIVIIIYLDFKYVYHYNNISRAHYSKRYWWVWRFIVDTFSTWESARSYFCFL